MSLATWNLLQDNSRLLFSIGGVALAIIATDSVDGMTADLPRQQPENGAGKPSISARRGCRSEFMVDPTTSVGDAKPRGTAWPEGLA